MSTAPATQWSASDAISFGWEKVKANPVGLLLPIFLVMIIQGLPNGILNGSETYLRTHDQPALAGGVRLVSWAVSLAISAFLTPGMLTILFKAARGQPFAIGDLFGGGRYFVNMFVTLLIFQLATAVGFMLCIIPGVILALGWSFATLLVVDKDMAPIEALKASWAMTTGHKMSLFVFGLLGVLVAILGMLAFCVGIIPAAAVIAVAQVYIYLRLSEPQTDAPPPAPVTF